MAVKTRSELVLARAGKVGKIAIDGVIGWDYFGMTYVGFKKALADLGKVDIIEIEINSPGGVVTEGVAMMNALREHGATIHTYNVGQAGSMGSAILLSGDRVFIPDNAMTFIHKPLNIVLGNADDMRKMAGELDKFETAMLGAYTKNFKGNAQGVHDLMASETWYSAEEMNDKFNNVSVITTGEQKAAAHSDPLEILGDIAAFNLESLASKALGVSGEHAQGDHTKEVDMTPEEITAMKAEIIKDTTSAVVEALDKRDAEAKKKSDALAETDRLEEAAAKKKLADAVVFEGDLEKPEDVQAHLKKVQMTQLKSSADLTTPEGVIAYQDGLAKLQGKEAPTGGPGSNAAAHTTTLGSTSGRDHSQEDINAVVQRMTS